MVDRGTLTPGDWLLWLNAYHPWRPYYPRIHQVIYKGQSDPNSGRLDLSCDGDDTSIDPWELYECSNDALDAVREYRDRVCRAYNVAMRRYGPSDPGGEGRR